MNPNLQKVIGGPSIPGTMQMKSLETLKLSDCHRLQSLPEFDINMSSLRTIDLNCSGIKYLPRSLGHLTSLQKIDLSHCSNLSADIGDASKILTAFLSLPSLRKLYMRECNVSELILPERNGCFDSLEKLDLSFNSFVSLPESINRFSCLQYLRLWKCSNLEALPELPRRIKELDLYNCVALTRIPYIVDLLENLQFLSLIDREKLVQRQDQLDIPQTNALEQRVPQCLLVLMDSGTASSNILCNRQEVVQVHLPCNYLFNWLHKSTGPQPTIKLSPSCFYSDKLKGFLICAISNVTDFTMVTDNGRVTITPFMGVCRELDLEHMFFFYIPIGKVTRGTDRNEKKDYCLLEVTNTHTPKHTGEKVRWGISLVYDAEVDMDFSDLTVTNSRFDPNKNRSFKVCVAPRIQI